MVVVHKRQRDASSLTMNSDLFRDIREFSATFVVEQPDSADFANRQVRLPVIVKIAGRASKPRANSTKPGLRRNLLESPAT